MSGEVRKYQENEIVIRPAKREDMAAVSKMIQELADFEKMPEGPKLSVKDLERDGFDLSPPAFRCLIAEVSPSLVVGYALYFPTYSTWEGRAMLLEDLCVTAEYRRRGIGGKLFDAVAKEAVTSGCSRLDFHVLEWNEARHMYEGRNAENLTSSEQWCLYRLSGEQLRVRAQCA